MADETTTPPPALPAPRDDELYAVTGLLWRALLWGWVLPLCGLCALTGLPLAGAALLVIGPFIGMGYAVRCAARGDRIAARFLVMLAVVVILGDLAGLAALWGGLAGALVYFGVVPLPPSP